jgi:dTDP-4-dehydrorhamnose reductase
LSTILVTGKDGQVGFELPGSLAGPAAIFAHAASLRSTRAEWALDRWPVLKPILTEQYPTPARRPRYSVLSNAKLQRAFGVTMPEWKVSLAQCMRTG